MLIHAKRFSNVSNDWAECCSLQVSASYPMKGFAGSRPYLAENYIFICATSDVVTAYIHIDKRTQVL